MSLICLSVPSRVDAATTVIFLTTADTSPWTVPADWNSSENTIECIGPGGNGADSVKGTVTAAGGGAGAYAKITNLTISGTVSFVVGAGGSQNDTYFDGAASTSASISCAPGKNASGVTAGAGGLVANSTGAFRYAGGNGGAGAASVSSGGGAGGGAAGPNGDGKNGGASAGSNTFRGGAGGGGADNGVAGDTATSTNGAPGGASGLAGSVGGFSGIQASAATSGTLGGGGGGGYGASGGVSRDGASASSGNEFDGSHGSGGGGGGGGGTGTSGAAGIGGGGGGYGGGGGGGGGASSGGGSAAGVGGTGGAGLIIITYTPKVADTPSRTMRLFEGFQIKFISGKIIIHQKQ